MARGISNKRAAEDERRAIAAICAIEMLFSPSTEVCSGIGDNLRPRATVPLGVSDRVRVSVEQRR